MILSKSTHAPNGTIIKLSVNLTKQMHNHSKYQSVDYDAIMKSIKITHAHVSPSHPTILGQNTSTLTNSKSLSVSRLLEQGESSFTYKNDALKKQDHDLPPNTNNFIYSSIIQDDLSK